MEYYGIKCNFTSKLRGRVASTEAMKDRIPDCININCFVFCGSPDIIFEGKSDDGVVAVTAGVSNSEVEDDDGDSDDSGSSGRIQMGLQMPLV